MTRLRRFLSALVLLGVAVSCDTCTRASVYAGCVEKVCVVEDAHCKRTCSAQANAWQASCEGDEEAVDPADRMREAAQATYGQ